MAQIIAVKGGPRRRPLGAVVAAVFALHISTAGFAQAPQAAPAPAASLKGVTYEDNVLRIRLDHAVPYRVFSLSKPERLVVELSNTSHGDKPYEAALKDDVFRKIRFAQFKTAPEKIARVVVEMTKAVPFQAAQEGTDILLRFGEKEAAASAAPAAPAQAQAAESLSGRVEETVESSASAAGGSRRARTKDILASLPKNPVTIDFDDAEIADVLRVLSEMSGINIIHAASVRGTVSVHLDQVPFNEAFNTILTMQGLVAQQMGSNILRILTPEELSADRGRAVVTYKTFTLNYSKASEVQPLLGSVKISPSAKADVDDRNNAVIVTDTPEGIAAAERLISEVDIRPQQVLIEAKIVEVSLTNTMDLGIQWEYATVGKGDGAKSSTLGIRETKSGTAGTAGTVTFGEQNTPGTLVSPSSVVGAGTVVSAIGPGSRGTGVNLPATDKAGITFGFINKTDILTATLSALSTEGKSKILSAPRIITLNNKQAKIQSGSRVPYSTVTISPGGTSAQTITFLDVGILLEVTPIINADDRVRLKVKPEASFPLPAPAGSVPPISTRNAETEVIIRDGETLVIGGLVDEQTTTSVSKVPLLGDIPVLGAFFRSNSDTKRRTELLIFVTPRIVRD